MVICKHVFKKMAFMLGNYLSCQTLSQLNSYEMSREGFTVSENNATLLSGAASFPRKLPERSRVGNSPLMIRVVGTGSRMASRVCVCASMHARLCVKRNA